MDVRDEIAALSLPTNDQQDIARKSVLLIDTLRSKLDRYRAALERIATGGDESADHTLSADECGRIAEEALKP